MEILGTRMGPGSMTEGTALKEKTESHLRDETPESKPPSFAKVMEGRKSPQELRPAESRRPEKTEVRERTREDVMASPKARKTSERETAMLKFMDSMESEFGITPARMLEAMADLKSEELTRPPEDTASEVIANLDLPSEEEPQAMEMYMQFLQQWKDLRPAAAAMDAKTDPAAVGGAIIAAGMDVKSPGGIVTSGERRAILNQSLDRMNDRFFMRSGLPEVGTEGTAKAETMARLSELGLEPVKPGTSVDARLAELLARDGASTELPRETSVGVVPTPAAVKDAAPGGSGLANPVDQTAELEDVLRRLNADPSTVEMGAGEAAATPVARPEPKVLDISALQVPGFGSAAALAAVSSTRGEASADLGTETGDTDLEGGRDGETGAGEPGTAVTDFSQLIRPEAGAKSAIAAGSVAGTFAPMEADHTSGLDALKDQAQLMVGQGGGEARIKLNQEGLGEVQLKVLVHDGKVNVEMKTDNTEAKKILESSIADLKQSLSSHKLSVDNVKVDVGTGDPQGQSRSMDFAQDQAREQARQMMQQFRDQSAARRDPFYEMSGIKAYGRKRAEPEPIAPAGPTAPRTMSGRGERMNLVA